MIKVRLRNQFGLQQPPIAPEVGLRFLQIRLGSCFVGQNRLVTCIGLVAVGDVVVRPDFHDQIALLDLLAFFDRQFHNLTTDFRTDLDLHHRLNPAVGRHSLNHQRASRDLIGLNGDDGFPLSENGRQDQPDQNQPDNREDNDLPSFLGGRPGWLRNRRLRTWQRCIHRSYDYKSFMRLPKEPSIVQPRVGTPAASSSLQELANFRRQYPEYPRLIQHAHRN